MFSLRLVSRSSIGALILILCAPLAHAGIVYDAGPSNLAQWRNSDSSNFFEGEAADDFVLDASYQINEISWFGSYLFTADQPKPDNFSVHFYEDVGNDPSTSPFHTVSFAGAIARVFTGEIVAIGNDDIRMYRYTVNIDPLILEGATTYWLSIVNDTNHGGAVGGWAWAYNQEQSTHRWRRYGGAWETYGSANLAFSLGGIPVSVPEPSTLGLLGLGLLGLIIARRKRA